MFWKGDKESRCNELEKRHLQKLPEEEGEEMKTHLCYIVLWMLSLFMLWGFFKIENARMSHEIDHKANKEPYALKKKLNSANKAIQAMGVEVMRLDRKLILEKEKNKEGRG